MAGTPKTRADDERVLRILHMLEVDGLSATEVGKRLGITRSAVLGYKHRALVEGYAPSTATRPENQDGALGPLWWQRRAAA